MKARISEAASDDNPDIYRLLVDAVADYAIFALDPRGHIMTWNTGARRLKGYSAEEVIGSHFSRFYSAFDVERRHPQYELARALAETSYEEEAWRYRKDGTKFWASVLITKVIDEAGRHVGFTKVTRDLTEKKLAEERLRASEARMRQMCESVHDRVRTAHEDLERRIAERTAELADAVRARDELVSIASHELKTPLTTLKLAAQMRLRYLDRGQFERFTPEKLRDSLEADEFQINRLSRLVDDMLDLSRLNLGKFAIRPERCDLTETLRTLIARVHESHPASPAIEVRSMADATGPWDGFRIEQALTNLLVNALRYGRGSRVTVDVESVADSVRVTVRDFGPGVARADRERIFLAFERAVSANEVSGLGLGLFISRRIAEAHGGSLHLASDDGPGTAFVLVLPLGPAPDDRDRP